jgi:hypothetical protein
MHSFFMLVHLSHVLATAVRDSWMLVGYMIGRRKDRAERKEKGKGKEQRRRAKEKSKGEEQRRRAKEKSKEKKKGRDIRCIADTATRPVKKSNVVVSFMLARILLVCGCRKGIWVLSFDCVD